MPIRIVSPPVRRRYSAISPFLPRLQLDLLAFRNDLNGGGARDFLHWAVPEEHAVLDAAEESAGLPKELLARFRANCVARREHAVRSRG
jgi:hypothetical protein